MYNYRGAFCLYIYIYISVFIRQPWNFLLILLK